MLHCEPLAQSSHDFAGCIGLLGQSSANWQLIVNHPEFTVPIGMMILGAIAIVGVVVTKVVRMLVIYRERIYRIEHGLDPDIPPDTYSTRRRG